MKIVIENNLLKSGQETIRIVAAPGAELDLSMLGNQIDSAKQIVVVMEQADWLREKIETIKNDNERSAWTTRLKDALQDGTVGILVNCFTAAFPS